MSDKTDGGPYRSAPAFKRRIVQIAASAGDEDIDILFALSDHGEVFFMSNAGRESQSAWVLLPPLPNREVIIPFVGDEDESDEDEDDEGGVFDDEDDDEEDEDE